MKNNFVMHGAAVNRVWMANQRRMSRVLRAGVEQGFESTGRAVNEQRPNCRTGEGQVVRLQELNHRGIESLRAGSGMRQRANSLLDLTVIARRSLLIAHSSRLVSMI
jgi:hypothetical protein